MSDVEMFQLVDRGGAPVGQASRAQCHGNPLLIHLVVHLHVFDAMGRLYLQKRGKGKDTNPGLWDTSVGGHVRAGEPLQAALLRESLEELGIDASAATHLYSFLNENSFEAEYAESFMLSWGGPISANPEEIEEGRFFALEEVERRMGNGTLTPLFEREWPRLTAAIAGRNKG
jgi:isopentenyldiphosphate isomerase